MDSEEDKTEKKKLKAEYKLEKKRLKTQNPDTATVQTPPEVLPTGQPQSVPWFKDSGWLRVIIGLASLIVAIIAIILTFSN